MYLSKSFIRPNSSNTGKHFDHCTLKSILLLCINAFKTWCERCFCGEKIERPFPNNVHTATLSVNCIETELTFVSKTCAVFDLTKSIRPATCGLLVHLQSSWWTFALFCDDITACNRIEFWINLFHNTSRDRICDIILILLLDTSTKHYLHYQILCFCTQNRIILLQSLVCISCPYLEARACNLFLIKCEKRFFV